MIPVFYRINILALLINHKIKLQKLIIIYNKFQFIIAYA